MEILGAFLLAAGASALLTAGACRLAHKRHRKAGWYLGALAAIVTGALAVLLIFQGDTFRRALWYDHSGKGAMIPPCFFTFFGISIIPALLIVRFYREKFRHENHVA